MLYAFFDAHNTYYIKIADWEGEKQDKMCLIVELEVFLRRGHGLHAPMLYCLCTTKEKWSWGEAEAGLFS